MDARAPAAPAAAARRHAVAAARIAGVAEASVRAVRLCAESGGLVVILCSYASVFQLAHLAGPKPVYQSQFTVRSRVQAFFQNSSRPPALPRDHTERKS